MKRLIQILKNALLPHRGALGFDMGDWFVVIGFLIFLFSLLGGSVFMLLDGDGLGIVPGIAFLGTCIIVYQSGTT